MIAVVNWVVGVGAAELVAHVLVIGEAAVEMALSVVFVGVLR